ncbi:MAG: hypothetical protein WA961_14610 [Rhodanobacter sp.]
MTQDEFTEISARCEALSRVVLHLAVSLEERGVIDGHRLQENLLEALPHGSPLMDRTALLMQELVGTYSDARSRRRTVALWTGNRPDRNDD